MSTLYWLTVLSKMPVIACAILVLILSFSVILFVNRITDDELDINDWIERNHVKTWLMGLGVISLIIVTFTPSKNELILIYGGGAILEYIQDNPQAKELPDNVIKYLNDYLTNKE